MKRFLSTSMMFFVLSTGVVLNAHAECGPPQPTGGSGKWPRANDAPSMDILIQVLQILGL